MAALVGREGELAELHRVAEAAAAGAGGLVVLEGEPGIGKTALLDAFADEAVGRHRARVLRGRAWEEGGAPPYWPWHEVAAAGGWALQWERRDNQFGLYADVLAVARVAAHAGDGPLLLLVDDLHAADEDTIRLTRYVARSIGDAPIALVTAARPSNRLASVTRLGSSLPLGALDDADADALIVALAHGALDASTRAGILAAADGNPLFLTALARRAATGRAVPADIVSVVTPWIDGHDSPARALAELASVLGREFPAARLAELAGMSLPHALGLLEPLRDAGVVSISGAPPRVMFAHQLVRDVLYDSMPPARRLDLHAAVARVIDSEPTDAFAERAHHLLAAVPIVDTQTAIAAARRAAEHARSRLAFADAATLLQRAVALTSDDDQRYSLLLELGACLQDGGKVNDASLAFAEAVDLSRQLLDPMALARAALARTALVRTDSHAAELVPLIAEALAVFESDAPHVADARRDGIADVAVQLQARRAVLLAASFNFEAALPAARSALAAARALGDGHDEALADALAAAHRCYRGPDELGESLVVAEELVEVATRLGDADRLSEALLAMLTDALRAGDMPSADHALERYSDFAARTRRPRHQFFLLSRQAMRAFLAGRFAEGERLIERAYELGERIEEPDALQVFHGARMVVIDQLQAPDDTLADGRLASDLASAGDPRLHVYAAHYFHRAGASDEAARSLKALVEAIPSLTVRSLPLFELSLAAEVASAVGAREVVEQLWAALRLYSGGVVNSGSVAFAGVVEEYLGLLAGARGRADDATQLLRVAVDRYRVLGAPALEQRAIRQLQALEGAPAPATAAAANALTIVFRRRGDGWEIGIDGELAFLRDARGLQHLHALLSVPGREMAATELVGAHASELAAQEARHALLDDRAKAAYRERIRDLQEDLDDADAASDVERSARLRAELDLLLDELRRAVGLLGRDRYMGATAERARVTVRKAIATSIDRIAEHDPRVAAVLRTTVKTGHQCCYTPSPLTPIEWSLD